MAMIPIYNPPVPYLGYIDGGFGPGRMVRIQGGISSAAQRFAINLQCGPNTNPRDDIAMHLSPRFMENIIMRSCLQNQSWSGEETHGSMPLARGQNFEIIVLCDPSNYKIAVNGQHFVEYTHRIPFSRVTHLTIDGDVTLSLITFEGGYAPPPAMGNGVPGYAPGPPMPTSGMMPGAMPPGPGAAPYPSQPGMHYAPQGPMPGYGAPPTYGSGPYLPPGQQPYGAYGGYGHPPPPPGYQQGKSSGGGILDKAGMALAGALGGAGIMGAVGGKYPTLPQGHGDSGSGSVGGLGSLGTLIGTGLAGAALSGVLGGKDTPATGNNPENKPKAPTHVDSHHSGGGGNTGTGSAGGLGYLGNLISPGLANVIQGGIMGGSNHGTGHNTYPNPYAQSNPSAGSAGGLGSLGSLIGTGLAGAIQSGIIGGQDRSQPNPYDRRSPVPPGYGPGTHNPYGNYGGGQAAGGAGLESLGGLIGSGLAGAIQSRLFSGGGTGGKEQSNRATSLFASKDDEKPDQGHRAKIDEDLIRSLDELIVADDKPLNKNVIKMVDAAPIKPADDMEEESAEEITAKKEKEVTAAKKEVGDSAEDVREITADDIFAEFAEKPVVKSTAKSTPKPREEKINQPVEEPIIKSGASDNP